MASARLLGIFRGKPQNHPVAVTLNIDLGELPDEPEELYGLATIVNVACGGHTGDRASMSRAVSLAKASGAALSAHPSYYDRDGFGRRRSFSPPGETRDVVFLQCSVLTDVARAAGLEVPAVKAHGGLYHDACEDLTYAEAFLDGAQRGLPDLEWVLGLPGSALERSARQRGLRFCGEGFADRRYDADMRLVPRGSPDALLADPQACLSQALMFARLNIFSTLCLHGDSPHALKNARAVHGALAAERLLGRLAP